MKIYAQLNEEDICVAVSNLSGVVEAAEMVDVTNEEDPGRFLGMSYNAGIWEEIPAPAPMPQEPTNTELAQLIMDLHTDLIVSGVV